MTIEIIKQHETAVCVYTNYMKDGKEWYICRFKDMNHPVNKKAGLFKMSGAEQE